MFSKLFKNKYIMRSADTIILHSYAQTQMYMYTISTYMVLKDKICADKCYEANAI